MVELTRGRGGARARMVPQSNNTSGLLGIWFRWAERSTGQVAEVCVVVGDKRLSRTVSGKRTARRALRDVIKLRAAVGLPVPTLGRAVRAFHRWADHG